jgi:hypothetical protein
VQALKLLGYAIHGSFEGRKARFFGAVDAGFGERWAEAVSQMTSMDGR